MQDNWNSLREQIEYFSKPFPREAIAFANAHREEVAPHLVDALARVVANPTLVIDDPDYILHEYAMHLLATWRDTRAYAPLVALGHWDEATLDGLMVGTLTESYARCLASVCDGNLAPLKQLFEDDQASIWSRIAALDAMVVRVMEGDLPRADVIEYLGEQGDLQAQRLRAPDHEAVDLEVIDWIVGAACDLAATELNERIQRWFDEDLIDNAVSHRSWVEFCMGRTFEAARDAMLEGDLGYVHDVEAEIGCWVGFGEEPATLISTPSGAPWIPDASQAVETFVRSGPKIGRNDPCPCGSGKKYKKCCGAS